MHHTLESYKAFPYVAWTLIISFTLFTYTLVVQLQNQLDEEIIGIGQIKEGGK
jgi:hypothetical protein